LIEFQLEGEGFIVGVDNGDPVSHEPFKAPRRKAFHGKCLVVVQSGEKSGILKLTATSPGLTADAVELIVN
jgi:beta-galactosidase